MRMVCIARLHGVLPSSNVVLIDAALTLRRRKRLRAMQCATFNIQHSTFIVAL
jgi:hypothetical protein